MVHHGADETSPLLHDTENGSQTDRQEVKFSDGDEDNPRNWKRGRRTKNLLVIMAIAILSPLSSSIFAPGISKISEGLGTSDSVVIGAQSGFVVMLGLGPMILAPLSETFGRKPLYLVCFGIFTLLQIPTALAKSVEVLIFVRTITGFFGAVGIANGGGTISDMYEPSERASIFGWYLLGPLLGPTLGPLLGGIILDNLNWPWVFWILTMICAVNVTCAIFFLEETYAPKILQWRKAELEKNNTNKTYYISGADDRPLPAKVGHAIWRPMRILFTQPIVLIMASYQALIFATTYSLYTQFEPIYGPDSPYGFSIVQVGLLYLAPGIGFLVAVRLLVPQIDVVFNRLTEKNDGKSKPEFRLPIANVGAILIPISLFWFAWTVEYETHWAASISSTFVYGIGQVAIFNAVQNYYIDAFEKYAASAIAAGAFFRSLMGGIVPLFVTAMFEKLGVGWGMSVFAGISVLLAPSPLLFYRYGPWLRERFAIDLE